MRRTVYLIAAAAFVLALGTRLANAPAVFAGDVPRIALTDDLYHFKRMASVPRLLDFDPDRGERGAFCPWPPLYDFAAGALARITGATSDVGVLRRVIWLPPLVSALFIALVAAWAAHRLGWDAGAALAVALALSSALIAESSIGDIDHHFLEAPLVFGLLANVGRALARPGGLKPALHGALFGLVLIAAMFIRPSLLVPAALAFIALFAFTDGLAAAWGFGIAAVAVALYRLTRPPGYPDQQWFLGWSHAALLGAAAVASAVWFLRPRSRLFALACGAAVVFATPSAPGAILFGSEYIGGNPWFRSIAEGRAIHAADFISLSTGAVLVWFLLAVAIRRRDAILGIVAGFGIVALVLTLFNARWWSVSIPLLALAAVVFAATLTPNLRRIALVAVAVPVLIQFAVWYAKPPAPVIDEREMPWVRAASFLRGQGPGRVLAPWSMGHAIDVLGGHPVIVDNFGTMSDEIAFDRAHDALLAHDENALARYCDGAGVRYIVLDNPVYGLQGAAAALGLDPQDFELTRLATSTWWWRAYYSRRAAHRFRLVYADAQASWRGTPLFRGPAIEIWERDR